MGEKWLRFWIEKSPTLDRRWGGYWMHDGALLYFLGSEQDARETFINDFDDWKWNSGILTTKEANEFGYYGEDGSGINSLPNWSSYIDHRGVDAEKPDTDQTGNEEFYIASRIINKDYVENNPEEFLEKLVKIWAEPPYYAFHYFLGGATNDVESSKMALNPPFRNSLYQLEFFSKNARDQMRKQFPRISSAGNNTGFGSGLNHHSKDEPDWENEFWGENLPKLKKMKEKYDSQGVFNCYHCLGYIDPNDKDEIVPEIPVDKNELAKFMSKKGQILVPGGNCITISKKTQLIVKQCSDNEKSQKFIYRNNKFYSKKSKDSCITAGKNKKQKSLKLQKCDDDEMNRFKFEKGHMILIDDPNYAWMYEFGKKNAVLGFGRRMSFSFGV